MRPYFYKSISLELKYSGIFEIYYDHILSDLTLYSTLDIERQTKNVLFEIQDFICC